MNMPPINHEQISSFCVSIGNNPLLVQGAGGNVSWKDGDKLWIKASGTWLAHAKNKSIFVPVDLYDLKKSILEKKFFVSPKLKIDSPLRPSIETVLHALLPHPIVVHIHPIEALSFLVLREPHEAFNRVRELMSEEIIMIPYRQPGGELSSTISSVIHEKNIRCIFLQNHGVVLGASSIMDMNDLISSLRLACQSVSHKINFSTNRSHISSFFDEYFPPEDYEINMLAINPEWFKRLKDDWVLFPDHAVFLGPKAFFFHNIEEFKAFTKLKLSPQLIFVKDKGVFYKSSFSLTQKIQLRCYLDLLQRIHPDSELNPLSMQEVNNLLNWDAEKFRQQYS
ncbi:class II aldolase [Polynucleobacter sp. MWH-UH24A]|uniref:class II aldolase/adducin family protein n=1 Tax=Polynucleobacter sp. MWH-UH24A TaxID=2689110 RepID=UPI001BFDA792|nr:class II aldolase/adducin family protein [Polynucleobacter sp. MWH-UH24A]QWD76369.1 class II aldolase [Polynucleobacter sp. MWH-UH24A]